MIDKLGNIFAGMWMFSVGWMCLAGLPIAILGSVDVVSEDAAIISLAPISLMTGITIIGMSLYLIICAVKIVLDGEND